MKATCCRRGFFYALNELTLAENEIKEPKKQFFLFSRLVSCLLSFQNEFIHLKTSLLFVFVYFLTFLLLIYLLSE